MIRDKKCCHLARLLGFFLFLSGFCMGTVPRMTMGPFLTDVGCPRNNIDYIDSEVTLDMSGVDKSDWHGSISIKDTNGRDSIQANYGPGLCKPIENNFFHCYEQDGDEYHFKYRLDSQAVYSGVAFSAVILQRTTYYLVRSNWQIYPVTQDGQLQFLTVNGETKSWRKGYQNYTVKRDVTLHITYNVTGINNTANHYLRIQGSNKKDLNSTSTEFEISTQVASSEGKIYVSYIADACNQTTEVLLRVSPVQPHINISQLRSHPNTQVQSLLDKTRIANQTKTKMNRTGEMEKPGSGGMANTVIGIIVAVIVVAILCFFAYKYIMSKRLQLICKKNAKLNNLLDQVEKNPKLTQTLKKNPDVGFEFYHKYGPDDGNNALNKRRVKVVDLVPEDERNNLSDDIRVDLTWSLDKGANIIRLDINNIINVTKEVEETDNKPRESASTESVNQTVQPLTQTESDLLDGTAV